MLVHKDSAAGDCLTLPHFFPFALANSYGHLSAKDAAASTAFLPFPIRNAVVLVPGIAGSGLYATLLNAYLPDCGAGPLTLPRTRLWASIIQALPPLTHQVCWARKLALDWVCPNMTSDCHPLAREYRPLPGIQIDVDEPGGVRGFDFLDYIEGVGVYGTKYFHDILQLLRETGYFEGDTLFGHPFDWRYPVWDLDYQGLKVTVERFVLRNPGKRVTLVAHSLGAVLTTIFLNRYVDETWKRAHIDGFVSIAGAFGGSHKAIRSLVTGYNDAAMVDLFGVLNVSLLSPRIARDAHRSFGSMYSLTPNVHVFDQNEPVIIVGPDPSTGRATGGPPAAGPLTILKKITAFARRSLQQLSTALGSQLRSPSSTKESAAMRRLLSPQTRQPQVYTLNTWWTLLPPAFQPRAQQAIQHMALNTAVFEDPQVPVYCFWSVYDTPTTETAYVYDTTDMDVVPTIVWDYGDNTLIKKSASYCSRWNSTVLSREFKNLDHMGILMDPTFVTFLVSLVSGVPLERLAALKNKSNATYSAIYA